MSEATFFSRVSKSLRSTFVLSSTKTRVISWRLISVFSVCDFTTVSRTANCSVFFPICSNMPSSLLCMSGIASKTGLISERRDSISAPTSAELNLSCLSFFMTHILIEDCPFVKRIFLGFLTSYQQIIIGGRDNKVLLGSDPNGV